jgi:hypothetical protein
MLGELVESSSSPPSRRIEGDAIRPGETTAAAAAPPPPSSVTGCRRRARRRRTYRDGLLLGFARQPRLSVVYPSRDMAGCAAGGVLLASSIVDLSSALSERSDGGTVVGGGAGGVVGGQSPVKYHG